MVEWLMIFQLFVTKTKDKEARRLHPIWSLDVYGFLEQEAAWEPYTHILPPKMSPRAQFRCTDTQVWFLGGCSESCAPFGSTGIRSAGGTPSTCDVCQPRAGYQSHEQRLHAHSSADKLSRLWTEPRCLHESVHKSS